MSISKTMVALRRLGLGPRPGEARSIAADPLGYVRGQLTRPQSAIVNAEGLPSSAEASVLFLTLRRERLKAKRMESQSGDRQSQGARKGGRGQRETESPENIAKARQLQLRQRSLLQNEIVARVRHSLATDAPFVERLVLFWSNHFCVSARKGLVQPMAGGYEREAVRQHVLGRFRDMLTACVKHPAMIRYLDNDRSIGPNSPLGQRRNLGLNENLAREVLELHTLGVDGGYTQADVTNFARILTGWTVGHPSQPNAVPGRFHFAAASHEPGEWTVLGKRYPARGLETGEMVLNDLSRHPSTARHIATKLARHFVADTAPAALVDRLAKAFRDTDGDLKAVAETLVTSPEVWSAPLVKSVPPYDYLVALVRGLGAGIAPIEFARLGNDLGQPVWSPPSPKGFPDEDDSWIDPSALRERLRLAQIAARLVDKSLDPRQAALDLFDSGLSLETRLAIAQAEGVEQGFVLLAMSPEFLRR